MFLGPMDPWAHEVAPRSRTTKPITFFPKLSIDEAHNILSKIIHSFDIFPYIPICPGLHFLYPAALGAMAVSDPFFKPLSLKSL